MAFRKEVIDIQAADGLQQKVDLRRLPPGKSAKALNLVKNKQGRLEGRLGFGPLSSTDPQGSNYSFSTGINLGNWNNQLVGVGRGTWPDTGAAVTCLSQYSDDLGGTVRRGQLPDLKVTLDQIIADTPNSAVNTTMVISGDTAVMAWLDTIGANYAGLQAGKVYTAAFELSTGKIIQPATFIFGSNIAYMRLVAVGSSFILCGSVAGAANITCYSNTAANLAAGIAWTNNGNIVTNMTTISPALGTFDMRAASGDSADFLIAYETTNNVSIICQRRKAATPSAVDGVFTLNSAPNGSISITAIGIRADNTTGRVAVAYCQPTDLTYPQPATAPTIRAAVGLYPSMGFENGSSTNDALLYTAPSFAEPPATWLDVVQCGSGGQLTGLTWAVVHSPYGNVWNGQPEGAGTFQSNTNRVVSGANAPTLSRSARIITNQFQDNATAIAPVTNTSGAHAGFTPGMVLASRGIEANGIAYFLGWIPSNTQGSFVALAYDQMANPTQFGNGYPMRPVGNLQTRTALSDPGAGYLYGHSPVTTPATQVPVAPNTWTGASEWQVGADLYGTSYVAYFGSTQGSRLQPAYGALQTKPLTGYATAAWGSVLGVGGGLPMCFDGQSVFEQGFLYAPEATLCVLGAPAAPHGPQWNSANDSYGYIFTWEQFDNQGNYHISARGGITITGLAGTPVKYAPTFYIPTLGVTSRGVFGSAPSIHTFSNALPPPNYPVTLGIYRTTVNGLVYLRLADRYFNNTDAVLGSFPTNSFTATTITYQDVVDDAALTDGTHPLLYGDGTNGTPGSLDNLCPPATLVMVRHKERMFVARGNQLLWTKQRGEFAGPGYNEQVNAQFVGDAGPIIGLESMDDKLVIFKSGQLFIMSGDGPADDGTGSSFDPPQPVPTDAGCSDPSSIRATPEGVYFMSSAGLRLLSRSLAVQYVGGPVEDELATYPDVRGVVLYPGQNRIVFAATVDDGVNSGGEMIWRDYVLDAWTTAQVLDGSFLRTAIALTVANAPRVGNPPNTPAPVLHFMTSGGVVWREKDPQGAQAYFDNATYITTTWQSPPIRQADSSRFRLWEFFVIGNSVDPHGLVVQIVLDNNPAGGGGGNFYTWAWNSPGNPSIRPGGVAQTGGLTRVRGYDGRMGTEFQIQVQGVSDPAALSGQGFQLLGLSLGLGLIPGPYKLPAGATQ